MKKSYKGLFLWVICLIGGGSGLTFLPWPDTLLLTNISMLYCFSMFTLLTYIIYKKDKMYWINGVIYEDTVKMTRQQRDKYTYAHFEKFFKFNILHLIFVVVTQFVRPPEIIIIIIPAVGIIITALSTMKIKAE